jgi:hypothetical protein
MFSLPPISTAITAFIALVRKRLLQSLLLLPHHSSSCHQVDMPTLLRIKITNRKRRDHSGKFIWPNFAMQNLKKQEDFSQMTGKSELNSLII